MKKPATGDDPGRAVAVETQSETTAPSPEIQARPLFVLRLAQSGIDGHKALRELLKRTRRDHGLRCLACHEEAGR